MTGPGEDYVTSEQLERILQLAGVDMILVGGQALAFWASYYGAPTPRTAITKDVDFIGSKDDVKRIALGLNASAVYPRQRAMTALTGQVKKDLPGGGYINIDVLHRVFGDVTTEAVASRAVDAENAAGRFRVMHPMDVLQGRLENVYGLADKQDEHGIAQLQLAIAMTRLFLVDIASQEGSRGRPIALSHISRIETMALSDAGRKVAARHKVHVADAIDPTPVAHVKAFMATKLPQLAKLMSPARRAELKLGSG